MMRRLLIAAPIVLVAAGAAAAGWHFLRPRDPLAQARQLLAHGDLRAAQLVLRSAVQANPARAEAHLRLGLVQLQLGDPAAAEHEFRAAGEHGWDRQALTPLLAQAVAAQGRDAEVLRDYTPDGLAPAQAASVLVARAQAHLDLGKLPEAAAAVAEAQRLAPTSIEPALAGARLALAGKDLAAADTDVAKALAIDPHSLPALMLQAELRAAHDDRKGALAAYSAAIDQALAAGGPGMADRLRLGRAGLLVAMGDAAAARTDLDAVLQAQPKQPVAQFLSARLFALAGDWKAADAALAMVGPLLSRLPQGDLTLAVVKANLGQPEQAIAAAQRQLARTPDNLAAAKFLAKLDLTGRQPDLAAAVLAAAAKAGHTLDAEALDLLGEAYAGAGRPDQAVVALRQASELTPDDARLLTRLGALELRQGDAPQAVQALSRALDAPLPPADIQSASAQAPAPPASGQDSGQASGKAPDQAQTAATLVLAALQAGDVDRAVTALDRLRQVGDPVQVATLAGTVKLAQIDLAGAQAAFETAVRLDPKAVPAQINLARVLALQGHSDAALARLSNVLANDRANTPALTALVNLALAAGHPEQALAAAEAAHKAAPDNAGIVAGLAGLYLRTGQPQKALDLLQSAPPPGAGSPDALLAARAQAELALGQREAAVQTLRSLLARAPDTVTLRRQIAELLAADHAYDEARVLLTEGLGRRPGDPVLLAASVAVARSQGGVPAALARAEELARDPANPAAAVLKGDVLQSADRFTEAAAAYQAQLADLPKDDPRAAVLEVRAAEAVAAGGDSQRAAAMLRDWLAAHPDSPEVALVLASLDISANRLADARRHLEQVLASQPNNPSALNNLAWVTQQEGDLAHASALASRAYLLGPTPQSADTLGWIMLAQNHVDNALVLLREAASGQRDPSIEYHLAAALARGGQKEAALAILKPLLDKPTGFGERADAAKLLADLAS